MMNQMCYTVPRVDIKRSEQSKKTNVGWSDLKQKHQFFQTIAKVLVLLLAFSGLAATVAAGEQVVVSIDGEKLAMPAGEPNAYINSENRTVVPARFVSEALGAEVDWDPATETVTVSDQATIELTIGSRKARVDGEFLSFDTAATITAGRTFVPLRFVSEALDYEVTFQTGTPPVAAIQTGLSEYEYSSDSREVSGDSSKDGMNPSASLERLKLYIADHPDREEILRVRQKMDQGAGGSDEAIALAIRPTDDTIQEAGQYQLPESYTERVWEVSRLAMKGSLYRPLVERSRTQHQWQESHTIETDLWFEYRHPREKLDQYADRYRAVADELVDESMTDREKVQAINDFLVETVDYDHDYENDTHVGAYRDGRAVCAGQATAAMIMLRQVGIPVLFVSGEATNSLNQQSGHAWNMVKVSGNWRHLDVTWNNSRKRNDYFLISDSEIAWSHQWNRDFFPAAD